MYLNELKSGDMAEVEDFSPELSNEKKELAENFGLFRGNQVFCVHRETMMATGVFRIDNLKIALEKELASKIIVKLLLSASDQNLRGIQ